MSMARTKNLAKWRGEGDNDLTIKYEYVNGTYQE